MTYKKYVISINYTEALFMFRFCIAHTRPVSAPSGGGGVLLSDPDDGDGTPPSAPSGGGVPLSDPDDGDGIPPSSLDGGIGNPEHGLLKK